LLIVVSEPLQRGPKVTLPQAHDESKDIAMRSTGKTVVSTALRAIAWIEDERGRLIVMEWT